MKRKIIKSVLAYMIFYFVDIVVFLYILYGYRSDVTLSFHNFLYYQFIKSNVDIDHNFTTGMVYFIQNIIDVSAVAVLTGYIFAYILNREPKIVFPDRLVIRHRTSWESKKKLHWEY